MSSSKKRQSDYRKTRTDRTLRRHQRNERDLPREDFTEKDFSRMEKAARKAMEYNHRRLNNQ